MLLLLFFFLGGGRGRWERARFERFLSIVISYFDQNGLGGGEVGESSIWAFSFYYNILFWSKWPFGGEVGESSIWAFSFYCNILFWSKWPLGGRWERARFERFLSIVISYFDQNGLGGGEVGESSIWAFSFYYNILFWSKWPLNTDGLVLS